MGASQIILLEEPPASAAAAHGHGGVWSEGAIAEAAGLAFSSAKASGVRRALVVCPSPVVKSVPVPVSRGMRPAEALAAGELAVRQATAAEGGVETAGCIIWTDPAQTAEPHRHVLTIAIGAQTLGSISAAGAEAGVRVDGVVSREGLIIIEAVRALKPREGKVTVLLWVDECETVLLIAEGSRLSMVRHLHVGLSTMVEMLAKVSLGADEEQVGRDRAGEWLREVGVPTPTQMLPGASGLRGSTILPALEPALQRLALEVRQSMRFSLSESVRAGACLIVAGPGGSVANLGAALSARTSLALEAETDGAASPGVADLKKLASRAAARGLVIRPRVWHENRERSRFRVALAAGAAMALSLAAVDWDDAKRQAELTRRAIEHVESESAAVRGRENTSQTLARRAVWIRMVKQAHDELGRITPSGALLSALAASTPPGLTLTSARLSRNQIATIQGHVKVQSGEGAGDAMNEYVTRLRECPAIARASLASVRREFLDGIEVQAFDITLEMVKVPALCLRPETEEQR